MNKLLIPIFLVLISITNISLYSQVKSKTIDGIKLFISTDKTNYLEGEEIWGEYKLIINKNVILDYSPESDLKINIKNSLRNYIPFQDGIGCPLGYIKEYADTMCYFMRLDYGYREVAPNTRFTYTYYLPADDYEFLAYVNVSIKGKIYKIEADPFKFTVYKPDGDELLARQEYLDLFQYGISSKDSANPKMMAEKYESFMKKFPNSVYVDRVMNMTKNYYFKDIKTTWDDLIDFYLDEIMKYPSFASNFYRLISIMNCYEYKKDSSGFSDLLNSLESKVKNEDILSKVLFYVKRDFDKELKQNKFK